MHKVILIATLFLLPFLVYAQDNTVPTPVPAQEIQEQVIRFNAPVWLTAPSGKGVLLGPGYFLPDKVALMIDLEIQKNKALAMGFEAKTNILKAYVDSNPKRIFLSVLIGLGVGAAVGVSGVLILKGKKEATAKMSIGRTESLPLPGEYEKPDYPLPE